MRVEGLVGLERAAWIECWRRWNRNREGRGFVDGKGREVGGGRSSRDRNGEDFEERIGGEGTGKW